MRKLILFIAFLPSAVLLAGCPKKPATDADASVEASASEASAAADEGGAAPAAVAAKNAADVARFPNETKIDNEPAKTLNNSSHVTTSPRAGNTVATLRFGMDVVKIAQKDDSYLITFPDPSSAGTTLMGWVGKEAFLPSYVVAKLDAGAHADAGPKPPPTCAASQIAVTLGGDPVCKKKCSSDADCKDKVKGSCAVAAAVGASAKAVHVCLNEP